jgi:hypothetical protein
MAEMQIETPFGRVTLSSPAGTGDDTRRVTPSLPEGLRVTGCEAGVLTLAFSGGETVEITLSAALAEGAKALRTAGGGVTGWEVEGPRIAGAFGLPDADRLKAAFGLELAGFNETSAQATFRLRAAAPVVAEIPFAAAWTENPTTEEDGVAPWVALDHALPD